MTRPEPHTVPPPVRAEFVIRARVGDGEWADLCSGWAWGRTPEVTQRLFSSALGEAAQAVDAKSQEVLRMIDAASDG
ncbi:hypothetical protein [Actinomadura litoris]|uniref:Uncharacterized protein n=1 Tax=Actinomadura litoris TaxID=2678616 RepID=A0A7K1LAG1_9ACTN|nr:hypothetical protein [Actinomadura litoris]MUN41409.1 hypothetical protein [Actinomadura litoris]